MRLERPMAERHELGELTLAMTVEPRGVVVEWLGKSASMNPESLIGPYLNGLTVRAMSLRVPLVHDFTRLTFFNSSTISTILRHLRDVEARGVPVHVRYAKDQRWQRTFFGALDVTRESATKIKVEAIES